MKIFILYIAAINNLNMILRVTILFFLIVCLLLSNACNNGDNKTANTKAIKSIDELNMLGYRYFKSKNYHQAENIFKEALHKSLELNSISKIADTQIN